MSLLVAQRCGIPGRLASVDLRVSPGERVAVIGPNGAGKTSLLRALAAFDEAGGEVAIGGTPLRSASPTRRRKLLGYVPAARDVVWPITVGDAVADGGAAPALVADWIGRLELDALAVRPLTALSTGERARAFLARALAPAPPVLLADEPLANLDPRWRLRTLDLLTRAAAEGAAVLASLHDLDAALAWGTRVLVLKNGELAADASPAELNGSDVIARVFGVRRESAGWAEA